MQALQHISRHIQVGVRGGGGEVGGKPYNMSADIFSWAWGGGGEGGGIGGKPHVSWSHTRTHPAATTTRTQHHPHPPLYCPLPSFGVLLYELFHQRLVSRMSLLKPRNSSDNFGPLRFAKAVSKGFRLTLRPELPADLRCVHGVGPRGQGLRGRA